MQAQAREVFRLVCLCISLWGYSYNRLKLAQLLGQLGVFLTAAYFMTCPFGLSQYRATPACRRSSTAASPSSVSDGSCLGVDVKFIQMPPCIFCIEIC
jgi:hypothetical protein